MEKNRTPHILVIRLSAMGDVAMTVPILYGLIKKYPDLHITVVTKPFFSPIIAQIPRVKVVPANVKQKHKGFFGLWKLYSELKVLNIDGVADLHNVLRSSILKQFFRLQSVPFIQMDKGRKDKKQLTDPNRKFFKPLKTTFERYAAVFDKLGYPIGINEMHSLPKKQIPLKKKEFVVTQTKIHIGIAPFAAFAGKTYPTELMEKVIALLDNTKKYSIVLFGGSEQEKKQLTVWEKSFTQVKNIAGMYDFKDELAVISNLDLMIAMDSGNAHLAAMYSVPTLTLWGVTHPYAGFYPFQQPISNALLADREQYPKIPTSIYGNKVPEGYEDVMRTITPESVVQKINEILSEQSS
ncbi:ADP-heptose:LPS heptosyltransferase [Maribacter sedimenticola]|uniref:ADP-heptose:LPS heptosyltransferase n=1 Tax=Maribacter sedimenticola TaxID=228956 RepID=A0ABY1SBZ9_9FLAO|nr:glycosyltransferase family 9 protein [Maribacter sedimenticola]SNR24686.1 ADP-heptose:LPS heptosyltransferase [Maribacter sedimenticola]